MAAAAAKRTWLPDVESNAIAACPYAALEIQLELDEPERIRFIWGDAAHMAVLTTREFIEVKNGSICANLYFPDIKSVKAYHGDSCVADELLIVDCDGCRHTFEIDGAAHFFAKAIEKSLRCQYQGQQTPVNIIDATEKPSAPAAAAAAAAAAPPRSDVLDEHKKDLAMLDALAKKLESGAAPAAIVGAAQ